jgi:nickel-dependent lactate racemase
MHDPADRKKLAYLATTKQGRRLYLSRAAIEADQLVVLGRRGYDPLLGYSGFEGLLYPELSDEATRNDLNRRLSMQPPDQGSWPVRQEASETAWLLGAPFLIQVIDGAGEEVSQVLAGSLDSGKDGQHLLNQLWRVTTNRLADTVIAAVAGDPRRHSFAELAAAAACASRVVHPGGRIVLLSQAQPKLGPGMTLLRQAENPAEALKLLEHHTPPDMAAAFQWASAAQRANLYFLSQLPQEVVEELFATPLARPEQVSRLLEVAQGSCLFLPDANKTLALVAEKELP